MEKEKKSIGAIVLVVLLLIATIVTLILATYAWAKYTSTQTGSATAQVAEWNVSFTEGKNSFTGEYSHVATGKIAPGTTGSFTITPSAASTEVCFNYTIQITSVKLLNGETELGVNDVLADGVTVSQVLSHITFTSGNTTLNNGATGTDSISGTYNLGSHNSTTGAASSPANHEITWTWPYELTDAQAKARVEAQSNHSGDATAEEIAAEKAAYNVIDTAAGKFAAGTTGEGANATQNNLQLKVNYTINAVQVQPGAQSH